VAGNLHGDGLDAAFERHVRLGRATRAGIKAMGLDLFSPDDDRSAVVTAVRMPDGIDSADLVRPLRERFGIWGGMTERERRALLKRRPDVASWRAVFEADRTRQERTAS